MSNTETADYFAELCISTEDLFFYTDNPPNLDRIIGFFPSLTEKQSEEVQKALTMKATQHEFFYYVVLFRVSDDARSIYAKTEWKKRKEAHSRKSKSDVEKLTGSDLVDHEMISFAIDLVSTITPPKKQNESMKKKDSRKVFDASRQLWVDFFPNRYRFLGQVNESDGIRFEILEGSNYSIFEFFEHGDKAIVIETDIYGGEYAGDPRIKIIPLKEAIETLFINSIPFPEDLGHFVADRIFDPDEAEIAFHDLNSKPELDSIVENLTPYDRQFLIAMQSLKAISPESKKTIVEVVKQVDRNADPNAGFKHCTPRLQVTTPPLVRKAGNSGFYLTSEGATVATRLAKARTS